MLRTLLSIFVFSAAVAAAAQDATVPTEGALTEERFLALLAGNHPAGLALEGDLGDARARREGAGLLADPRLAFDREQPDGLPRETTWGVAWTPPLDGRRGLSKRAADVAIEAERSLLDSGLTNLRFEQREAYARWAGGDLRVSILGAHTTRLESLARRMAARAESGEESLLNARRFEIESSISRAALAEAAARAATAKATVGAWLRPVDGELDRPALRPELPELPGIPADIDLAHRPDLAAANSRVAESEIRRQLSRRFVAAPDVLLGWQTIDGLDTDFSGPVFGVSWAVPIFDRRQDDRLAADTALAAAQARAAWTTLEAEGELEAAQTAYLEIRSSAADVRSVLEGLDEVALAATESYEHGESGVTDLLDRLKAVLEARLSALDLHLSALEAHRRLELATGLALTSGGSS